MLEKISKSSDLKKLNYAEKEQLAEDIRKLIIKTVSKTGGHLASNLGVVELTIALHSIFNVEKDRIVWDVGHQSYVHKILTGRKNQMESLRKLNGIAGFPKVSENQADSFNTGHSSTSISVALGMARARDLLKQTNKIIAVIGDGALTGGMAEEALNDAGSSNTDLIVILNDNEMSISKNIGGISRLLTKIRTKKFYTSSNSIIKRITKKIPVIGIPTVRMVRRIKNGIKQLVIPNMYFEDIGFKYLGPVNGHDIEKLEDILTFSKKEKGPVLIHVITKKGKGYKPAEENPDTFHSTGSFDIETGEKSQKNLKDYSKVFGDKLIKLAQKNEKIVAITAAMKDGTGLTEFAKLFPDRFFDVGIAEQHALGMAAGMAKEGLIPVVPIYSSFLQRGYDQIIHDICIQNLPVIIGVDRAGIVGQDGETHQGILDLAFLNTIPNITIMAPKDFQELEDMLEYAIKLNKPVAIRYPKGKEEKIKSWEHPNIEQGKSELILNGNDITIIAIGKMVARAQNVADKLEKIGIHVELINTRFLKPIDKTAIIKSIEKTHHVVTIEDGTLQGGLYTKILQIINQAKINAKILPFGYPDKFIKHGTIEEIENIYGLDEENIVRIIGQFLAFAQV